MATEKRLIDANELDNKLEALAKKYAAQGRFEVAKDYSFVQTVLLTAPTVDAVEVVPGHNLRDHDYAFECSVCGWEDWDTLTADTSQYNYCPNCGAKMTVNNEHPAIL